jgi:hypothetical protein
MTKIELGKRYVTRDGRNVVIYSVNGAGSYCVHGAVKTSKGYNICTWTEYGYALSSKDDLIKYPFLGVGFLTGKSGNFSFYIKEDGVALTANNGDNRATVHLTKGQCIELANILNPPAKPLVSQIPTSPPPPISKTPKIFDFFRREF